MPIVADTFEQTYEIMRQKLDRLVPEIELKYKAELAYEINRLKKENRELRKKRGESLKEELRNVMVTGKSIAGGK